MSAAIRSKTGDRSRCSSSEFHEFGNSFRHQRAPRCCSHCSVCTSSGFFVLIFILLSKKKEIIITNAGLQAAPAEPRTSSRSGLRNRCGHRELRRKLVHQSELASTRASKMRAARDERARPARDCPLWAPYRISDMCREQHVLPLVMLGGGWWGGSRVYVWRGGGEAGEWGVVRIGGVWG